MKKVIAVMAAVMFFCVIGVNSSFAGRVGKRQVHQKKRISRGVKNGELTKCETRSLVKEQRNIQHTKRRAWSDGELTDKERVKIEAKQDKASAHIYRLKHNDRTRK